MIIFWTGLTTIMKDEKTIPTQCYKKKLSSISNVTQVTWMSWLCGKNKALGYIWNVKIDTDSVSWWFRTWQWGQTFNIGTLYSACGFVDAAKFCELKQIKCH